MQPDDTNTFKPGSWGTSSLPPAVVDRANAPTGNVEVVRAVTPPAGTPPAPPTSTPAPVPPPLVGPPAPASDLAGRASPPPGPVPGSSGSADGVQAGSGVRLGFADGSDLQLDPEHPHSLALKAVADVLLHRGPNRRRAG